MTKIFIDISRKLPDLNSRASRKASETAKNKECGECKLTSSPIQKIYSYNISVSYPDTSGISEGYEPMFVCNSCLSKKPKMDVETQINNNQESSSIFGFMSRKPTVAEDKKEQVYPILNEQGQIISGIHGISEKYADSIREEGFVAKYGYQYASTNTWDKGGELKPY